MMGSIYEPFSDPKVTSMPRINRPQTHQEKWQAEITTIFIKYGLSRDKVAELNSTLSTLWEATCKHVAQKAQHQHAIQASISAQNQLLSKLTCFLWLSQYFLETNITTPILVFIAGIQIFDYHYNDLNRDLSDGETPKLLHNKCFDLLIRKNFQGNASKALKHITDQLTAYESAVADAKSTTAFCTTLLLCLFAAYTANADSPLSSWANGIQFGMQNLMKNAALQHLNLCDVAHPMQCVIDDAKKTIAKAHGDLSEIQQIKTPVTQVDGNLFKAIQPKQVPSATATTANSASDKLSQVTY